MCLRTLRCFFVIPALVTGLLVPCGVFAEQQAPASAATLSVESAIGMIGKINLDINVKGPSGVAIEGMAVVTLIDMHGMPLRQETTKAGLVRFYGVPQTEYTIQVLAPAYERAVKRIDAQNQSSMKVTIELQRVSDVEDAAFAVGVAALAPKVQKEVGKAIEALRSNKPADARGHLEAASRLAPKSAEVQYLYGLYSAKFGDNAQAKSYWSKTLELYPQHFGALVSLGEALLKEGKTSEALQYLERALQAEPTAWRAHAIAAGAYLRQGSAEQSIKEAERALELGHGKAAMMQPVLAAALMKHGERERATAVLQNYLQEHPGDADAKKQLVFLQTPPAQDVANSGDTGNAESFLPAAGEGIADVLPSSWLPPDIDEKASSVEPGTACALDEVMKNAGARIEEFLKNVDRFAATESVKHESINKWGIASDPITRKFDYLVAVQEVKSGLFNVEEYRSSVNFPSEFPDGIETNGLPAMVLIFHPHNAGSFDFTCEGLARWNGGLAWQMHFRQRADRPNTMRKYRLGAQGLSYPVALKGRAWIAADSYQIVRMETQEIAP
ncbi:MAG TPA: tetratricopeptide repeat protein, partial [Candidatus Acidoferrum sp.]|nr:tetratricopeptide repeat protein [Candidatus Acidoferrum sp.]